MERAILILTQPLGKNYGGILQAYALQKVLKDLGHCVVTLNHVSPPQSISEELILVVKRWVHKYILWKPEVGCVLDSYYKRKNHETRIANTMQFVRDNLTVFTYVGEKVSYHKIKHLEFDTVLVGSDQVWRPNYSVNIRNYFLDFLCSRQNILRLSYAASFGTDEWEFSETLTTEVKALIQQFQWVSVREKSGVDLCSKFLDVTADWVLDPVLLLTRSDYLSLVKTPFDLPKRGVYTYLLDDSKEKQKVVSQYSEVLCKESYSVYPNHTPGYNNRNMSNEWQLPTVQDWLKGFVQADFIVTDSYHGTLFAIIFQIPFLCIVNPVRGSSRMESLLELIGLSHRLVTSNTKEIKDTVVDFSNANLLLQKHRKDAISMLQSNLLGVESFNC